MLLFKKKKEGIILIIQLKFEFLLPSNGSRKVLGKIPNICIREM